MFIRTERLLLRPAWPEDAAELHAAIAHEQVVRNLARAPWPYLPQDAEAFVGLAFDRRYPALLITRPADGSRIIGGVGLHRDEHGAANLGYWLAPGAWGHGHATEAASALLRVARILGHGSIRAFRFADNPASGRVLEKLGFRVCGAVEQRASRGRGGKAPSIPYALCLGDSDDTARTMGDDRSDTLNAQAA